MVEKGRLGYLSRMRTLFLALLVLPACKSESTTAPPAEEERVLACAPATDAGILAAADAGVTAKIIQPKPGQTYTTTEKITFQGTGSDPKEGNITDKTRMIWNILDPVKGPTPDGEGPDDTAGPYKAGTYVIRFDVSNKDCVTAADAVTITVQ